MPNVGAGRRRREASGKERLVYRFSGFGVDYELQLEPNEALLSPAAYMQTVEMGSDGNENVVSEDIVDEGCHLAGWALADAGANASQYRGQAAVSVCDGNMVRVSALLQCLCFSMNSVTRFLQCFFSLQTGVLKMLHYEMLIRVDTGGQNHKDLGQAHVLHRRARGTKATGEEQECHVTHAGEFCAVLVSQPAMLDMLLRYKSRVLGHIIRRLFLRCAVCKHQLTSLSSEIDSLTI